MNLSQFDLFCQIARVKSFSKAAKLLHISQPAISAQIQSMEDYYSVRLFDRTPQGVSLTAAGTVLYDYAQKILAVHDDLERKLAMMCAASNRHLHVGATPTAGSYALACGIWTFKDKYPELDISLEIASSQNIIGKMLHKDLNLAIVEGPVENLKGIEQKTVFTDELIAIVPNEQPWRECTTVSLQDLLAHRLTLREEGSELHAILNYALQPLGMTYDDLKPRTIITNFDAIKSAVEAGYSVSICLRLAVQKEIRRGSLLARPIESLDSRVTYSLLYPDSDLTSVSKRFIRFIVAPGELEVC